VNPFQDYIDHGWKICRIEPGTKGPRTPGWNNLENAAASGADLQAAGLLHAYSGTCALDIDDWVEADRYLQSQGVDLTALFMAPDAVQLSSGRTNRGKLIYKLDTPIPSKSWGSFELRCATAGGKSVQDVLPGTIHPETGKPYFWVGDFTKLPSLPESLLRIWRKEVAHTDYPQQPVPEVRKDSNRLARMKKVIDTFDPDMSHDDWLKVGMALHHESGGTDEGLKIWVEWSSLSKHKYLGYEHVAERYRSFGGSSRPVTGDYILHQEVADIHDFDIITEAVNIDFDAPKAANPFIGKFYTLGQFGDLPQIEWIIKHKLPKQGLGTLYAPWGAGKSFVALDLSLSVSNGSPWRGLPVEQGAVAYIAPEDVFGIRMRLSAAAHSRGLSDAKIHVFGEALRLQEKQYREWMTEAMLKLGKISLVFIDTLTAGCPGLDENSNKELGLLMDETKRMQEKLECMVMFLHHTGKDASRGTRGGTALPGAADAMWEIQKEGNTRELVMAKIKNGPDRDKHGNQFKYPFSLVEAEDSCIVEWLI